MRADQLEIGQSFIINGKRKIITATNIFKVYNPLLKTDMILICQGCRQTELSPDREVTLQEGGVQS